MRKPPAYSDYLPFDKIFTHPVKWVNDHIEICDRLDERVQLMEDYLDSKPDDFDGIAVKRFLLGQAREQVSWYRQCIEALDYVGCIACRRSLESGQGFLEHYLPAYNVRETERGTEYQRDTAFPLLPAMWTRFEEGYLDVGEATDDEIFDLC